MSDGSVASGKPSLAAKIDTEKSHPLAWKTVAKRAAVVAIAGISLYLVFPAITEVLASWPRLSTLDPRWFAVAIGAEIAHFIARSRCSGWRCGPRPGSRSSRPSWPAMRSP